MSNKVDEETIKEFFDYFGDTALPDPEHYPIRFQFLIDSFVHHKNMKGMKNDHSNISTIR
jgi:hypothetical protein